MIFVDAREYVSEGMKKTINILKNEGRDVVAQPLEVGDVIVQGQSKVYILEIKRGFDLLASMNSERMWDELVKLKNARVEGKAVEPIILFEGNMGVLSRRYAGSYEQGGEKKTKYLFRSKGEVKSALARVHSILSIWKVPMMVTSDYYQTGLYIAWLDEAIDREKKEKELRISLEIPKDLPPDRQAIEVLGALVGAKTALAIFKKYHTLFDVIRVAYAEGADGFKDVTFDNGRHISKEQVERLTRVVTAGVRV
jgi:ERCC4-type nuclease